MIKLWSLWLQLPHQPRSRSNNEQIKQVLGPPTLRAPVGELAGDPAHSRRRPRMRTCQFSRAASSAC